ncbi:MAG: CpsD/CapB family tyrosine-protein kinase [Proteobacteria bacterium]|nr:CpsD/CapB family tyrosine-protein kinase [Pseudomonadota bacterium]
MDRQSSQSQYLKQFLGKKNVAPGLSNEGSAEKYKENFLSIGASKISKEPFASSEKENIKKETKTEKPMQRKEFLWEHNAARFSDAEMPFLSGRSVKQLESNFRELMMIEANIAALSKGGNTIYISSCSDGDGKTISAISAAYALSFYSGKNVLLVDGNHHNPQIHNLFGISQSPGFFNLCTGNASIEEVVLPTIHRGLSIITIGDVDERSGNQDQVKKVIEELSIHFDYVICDGSSVMSSSLALRDIKYFSTALLVLECEKTRWEVLQIAEDKIKKSGGPATIGVVFNKRKYYIPSGFYKLISKK